MYWWVIMTGCEIHGEGGENSTTQGDFVLAKATSGENSRRFFSLVDGGNNGYFGCYISRVSTTLSILGTVAMQYCIDLNVTIRIWIFCTCHHWIAKSPKN